jgi:hypothetical protein
MEATYRFLINVYLEGIDVGELWVEIPRRLYERVNHDAPRISNNPQRDIETAKYFGLEPENIRTFKQTMEEDYPEIAERINKRITDAMYSGEIVDLNAVADICGESKTFYSHDGAITTNYIDVDDYVTRVERSYNLLGEWDEEKQLELQTNA